MSPSVCNHPKLPHEAPLCVQSRAGPVGQSSPCKMMGGGELSPHKQTDGEKENRSKLLRLTPTPFGKTHVYKKLFACVLNHEFTLKQQYLGVSLICLNSLRVDYLLHPKTTVILFSQSLEAQSEIENKMN